MINVIIKKSTKNNKKYDAYFPDKKYLSGIRDIQILLYIKTLSERTDI